MKRLNEKGKWKINASPFFMNKASALILLVFSLIVGLGQSGSIAAAVITSNIAFPKIAVACTILILCIVGVVKSVSALKRGSDVVVLFPASSGKKVIYYLGSALLIISGIVAVYTVGLIAYLYITNTTGVPAGMGFAVVLVLYVVGQALKGLVQETHNNEPHHNTHSLRE